MLSSAISGTTRPERGEFERLREVLRPCLPLRQHRRLSQRKCTALSLPDLRQLGETTLLGKPFPKPPLDLFLRDCALRIRSLQSISHLLDDIEMILNVFKRAIIRQLA